MADASALVPKPEPSNRLGRARSRFLRVKHPAMKPKSVNIVSEEDKLPEFSVCDIHKESHGRVSPSFVCRLRHLERSRVCIRKKGISKQRLAMREKLAVAFEVEPRLFLPV